MGEPRDRRWFLGAAAAAAVPVAVTRRPRHRRTAASAAAATVEGNVPVTVVSTGSFNPPPPAFPNASTTGYQNAPGYPGSLTPGPTGTVTSGTTFNFNSWNTTLTVGSSGTPASNVTFNGCRFSQSGSSNWLVGLYGDNITFNYCSFEPNFAPPADQSGYVWWPSQTVPNASGYQYAIMCGGGAFTFVQQMTVSHCNLWGFGNVIATNGSTLAKPQTFQFNWIHDARMDGGTDHTDGIFTNPNPSSMIGAVINNNTIISDGNTQGIAFQGGSANPYIYQFLTITNNLLGGFGYTVAVYDTPGGGSVDHINFSGNTYTTLLLPRIGPLFTNAGFTGFPAPYQWRNNTWHVPPGAAWGVPAHDGFFWMPVAGGHTGTDDTPYVSATDFTG